MDFLFIYYSATTAKLYILHTNTNIYIITVYRYYYYYYLSCVLFFVYKFSGRFFFIFFKYSAKLTFPLLLLLLRYNYTQTHANIYKFRFYYKLDFFLNYLLLLLDDDFWCLDLIFFLALFLDFYKNSSSLKHFFYLQSCKEIILCIGTSIFTSSTRNSRFSLSKTTQENYFDLYKNYIYISAWLDFL